MRLLPMVLAAVVATLGAAPTAGERSDPLLGRSLAATCANCHGTDGVSKGVVASLAGQKKEDLIRKMQEFKAGNRPATIMQQLAKGYSDEQIELIAAWFSGASPK